MKKPHEQKWERVGLHVECDVGCVSVEMGRHSETGPTLDIIAAAPDMARVLLQVRDDMGADDAPWWSDLNAALRKAGVLP